MQAKGWRVIPGPRRKGEGDLFLLGFWDFLDFLVFWVGGVVRGALGVVCFGLMRKTVQAPGRNLHP